MNGLSSSLKLLSGSLRRSGILFAIALGGLIISPGSVIGQPADFEARQQFLSDPLTTEPRDSFLPLIPIRRPLSPLERFELENQLNALDRQSRVLLAAGETNLAFEQWLRELRLRRVLGEAQEMMALERIGTLAWENQRTRATQLITLRLKQIRETFDAQDPREAKKLETLADLFLVLRDQDSALGIYQALLSVAVQEGDIEAQAARLIRIGEIHLDWFEFDAASETYRQLLAIARAEGESVLEEEALKRLVSAFQQGERPAQAIPYQQELIAFYQAQGTDAPIPALEFALAQNYQAVNRPDQAAIHYQAAYAAAQRLQQYGYSSNVLWRLADLYRSLNRYGDALYVLQLLVEVEKQSYNAYGIMNVFDQIAQIYKGQGETEQAIDALREGLILARQLNYRQGYFEEQIQSLTQTKPSE
ncbi:MAG: hypothetical protein QNJ46_29455 [Leptolyngbyaceae cyanobacterium MO_188.B28]|nr:hypothetical protein [Leptolyngbyaceae cyanobacterium MO_188.B28]